MFCFFFKKKPNSYISSGEMFFDWLKTVEGRKYVPQMGSNQKFFGFIISRSSTGWNSFWYYSALVVKFTSLTAHQCSRIAKIPNTIQKTFSIETPNFLSQFNLEKSSIPIDVCEQAQICGPLIFFMKLICSNLHSLILPAAILSLMHLGLEHSWIVWQFERAQPDWIDFNFLMETFQGTFELRNRNQHVLFME